MDSQNHVIGVIGLGYVGLPVAVAFGRQYPTIGYDIKPHVIASYQNHVDPSGELSPEDLKSASFLEYTSDPRELSRADVIIVAVPTPIDHARQPDLGPLTSASATAGKHMKKGAIVVFESTVYPGATEEVCVPILESVSGWVWKKDFHVGYSPERINPGDKKHTLTTVMKVVSADTPDTLERLAALYGSIIPAGVYPAPSIKTAEAAKVIENTQRDLNIALMNELSVIFDRLGIDTMEVLKTAETKWNFLPFRPGLVGGHCIGVDPYYLTYKAETAGYHPQVILAGRRINDSMGKFIAEKTVKMLTRFCNHIKDARVGIFGLTFKENCADLRNSKVVDIIDELKSFGISPLVHDPLANADEAKRVHDVTLTPLERMTQLDAIIIAVSHQAYISMPVAEFIYRLNPEGCIIDVKSILDPLEVKKNKVHFWRL